MQSTSSVKVLYLVGPGRAGGTIIASLLAEIGNFVTVGELMHIWDRQSLPRRWCGCRKRILECEVWKGVFRAAFTGMSELEWQRAARIYHQFLPTRRFPRFVLPFARNSILKEARAFLHATYRLYAAIRDMAGGKVIVDTSRAATYGYLLQQVPGLEVHFLQLTRDPRGVAYSWQKKQVEVLEGQRVNMKSRSLLASAADWNAQMLAASWLLRHARRRSLCLRYEDFAHDPRAALAEICRFVGAACDNLPDALEDIQMSVHHTFAGNYNRFRSGCVQIVPDQQWRADMPLLQQRVTALLTWPWRRKYGY